MIILKLRGRIGSASVKEYRINADCIILYSSLQNSEFPETNSQLTIDTSHTKSGTSLVLYCHQTVEEIDQKIAEGGIAL